MTATEAPTTESGYTTDMAHVSRGLCMGCADVVPGVSGGTVALILGIYPRLVTAISHVDGHLLRLLRQAKWSEAMEHLDLRFLVSLGSGIVIGVVGMSLVINRLLTHPTWRCLTLAAFFGMIASSAVVISLLIQPQSVRQAVRVWIAGIVAAIVSWQIALLDQLSGTGDPSYGWLFVCGAVAICAMILPGISGAMILLVLGVYVHLTEVPKNLLAGEHVAQSMLTLLVFGSGCVVSLVLFSKVLRYLLGRHSQITMAILCGLMFGALVKLWPFQHDLTPEIEKFKHKEFALYFPNRFDSEVALVVLTMVASALLVLAADFLVKRRGKKAGT